MATDKEIVVEVAYASPDEQLILETRVATDATVERAVQASGILQRFPEIDLRINKVGIFGKLTPLTTRLRNQDRVEIYRPLIADPKQTRKQRAAKHKSKHAPVMGSGTARRTLEPFAGVWITSGQIG